MGLNFILVITYTHLDLLIISDSLELKLNNFYLHIVVEDHIFVHAEFHLNINEVIY